MQIANKPLTKFVKSVKAALKRDHKLDLPHAALRASVLSALGENAHAFAGKAGPGSEANELERLRKLIAEAPRYFHPGHDFEGRKLQWIVDAGLVPYKEASETAAPRSVRVLYLAEDEVGCLETLALDAAGVYGIPEGLSFSASHIIRIDAKVPRVKKYGLPSYLEDSHSFFMERFGLAAASAKSHYEDLGDDSGDSCQVALEMPDSDWTLLVRGCLDDADCSLAADVGEWVGLHYGRNFDNEPAAKQLEWAERFLGAEFETEGASASSSEEPVFEWVWPDEDSDNVPCEVNAETGRITVEGAPEFDPAIRFRVIANKDSWDEVFDVKFDSRQDFWYLPKKQLAAFLEARRAAD